MLHHDYDIAGFARRFNINEAELRRHVNDGPFAAQIFLYSKGITATAPRKAPEAEARPEPATAAPSAERVRAKLEGASSRRHGVSIDRMAELGWRVPAIISCPEAQGRQASARHLAHNTTVPVDVARAMLASTPYEPLAGCPEPAAAAVRTRPDQSAHPGKTAAADIWSRVVGKINRETDAA